MRTFLSLLLSSVLLGACVSQKQYQALENQAKRLQEQLSREREELAQAQGLRYSLESQLQAKIREAAQAGQLERDRLTRLMRRHDTLVAEHNLLADHYARLTTVFDSAQRENTRLIEELQTRLGTTRQRTTASVRKATSRSRRRRR
jgi:putative hemolysin